MCAEAEVARQWIAKARNDLLNADNNLASKHVPTDTVCFHCQQAAEKLLKAVRAERVILHIAGDTAFGLERAGHDYTACREPFGYRSRD